MITRVEFDAADRQMVLLALAELALSRPGWDHALGEIAERFSTPSPEAMSGRELFDQFKEQRIPRFTRPTVAQYDDPDLLEWLSKAKEKAGGFLSSLADAGLRADLGQLSHHAFPAARNAKEVSRVRPTKGAHLNMAAHVLSLPEFAPDPEPDRSLRIDCHRCRFCSCTEDAPCLIPIRKNRQGHYVLAADEFHASLFRPCSWYIPECCTNPKCVAKLIIESIDKAAAG